MSVEEARIEIEMGSGTQFWPDAVDAFMTIASEELEAVRTDEHRESAK